MRRLQGRDVGLVYALLVLIVGAAVFAQPHGVAARAVLDSSTNLRNLRAQPLSVLLLSAFVLASPWSLLILPLLIVIYGAAQRWIGRVATVLVAASGHVFSTLVVALLVNTGIAHHQLSRRLANEPDVGVSYGVAALAGLLVYRVPSEHRRRAGVAGTGLLAVVLAVSQTFTDLGHLVAWLIGLSTGLIGTRMTASAQAEPPNLEKDRWPATDLHGR